MSRRLGVPAREAVIGLLLLASSIAPAPAQVTVEFDPDTLLVAPGESDRAFITVRNTSDTAASSIAYEWLIPDSVSIDIDAPLPETLEPREAVSTMATVRGRTRPGGSRLLLRVSFQAGGRSRVSVEGLRVAGRTAPGPSEVVDLEVVGSLASLHDGDRAYLFLQVSNKTDYAVSVDSVIALGPEFIHFDTAGAAEVAPRAVDLIRVDLEADDWVRPGTHTLFFVTYLGWTDPGGDRHANLVVSRDIEIGVLGESEILKVLSLPSFLLLPGFLMVIAFVMARKWTRREKVITEDPKKAEFWVVAVFLSLLWVYVYPTLGGRSYLRGYGMVDVAWVWGWSIGLGIAAALVRYAWTKYQEARAEEEKRKAADERAARTSASDDSEIETLRKLALRGQTTIRLQRAGFEIDGRGVDGFVIQDLDDDGGWVAPEIRYGWREGRASPDQREGLDRALASGEPGPLATVLDRLVEAGAIDVYWHRQGSFEGVRHVPEGIERKGEDYLVREEIPDD